MFSRLLVSTSIVFFSSFGVACANSTEGATLESGDVASAASVASNKGLTRKFFELVSAGNVESAFTLVSEDVQWWVPEELPFSGTKTKEEYMQIVKSIESGFPGGFEMKVISMLGESDQIAVEVESNGLHVNGKTYNNKYHFLVRFRSGKMVSVKEYMNTLHLFRLISG